MQAPYIAFSVTPTGALMVSTLSGPRMASGQPFDIPLDLGQLNDAGRDAAALDLGRYVLGYLNLCHPGLLRNAHPNLFLDITAIPSHLFPTTPPRPLRLAASKDDPGAD